MAGFGHERNCQRQNQRIPRRKRPWRKNCIPDQTTDENSIKIVGEVLVHVDGNPRPARENSHHVGTNDPVQ